jgi:hypothetical protein
LKIDITSKKVPSKEESHYNTIIYNTTVKEFKKATKKLWPLFWPARLSLKEKRPKFVVFSKKWGFLKSKKVFYIKL